MILSKVVNELHVYCRLLVVCVVPDLPFFYMSSTCPLTPVPQRRSQVSLAGGGGLTEFQGGGINLNTYRGLPIKCQGRQPRGGAQIFPGGAEPPPSPPPWLRACCAPRPPTPEHVPPPLRVGYVGPIYIGLHTLL